MARQIFFFGPLLKRVCPSLVQRFSAAPAHTQTHTHTHTHTVSLSPSPSLPLGENPLEEGSERDNFHSLQNQGLDVDHSPSSSDQVNQATVYILSSNTFPYTTASTCCYCQWKYSVFSVRYELHFYVLFCKLTAVFEVLLCDSPAVFNILRLSQPNPLLQSKRKLKFVITHFSVTRISRQLLPVTTDNILTSSSTFSFSYSSFQKNSGRYLGTL